MPRSRLLSRHSLFARSGEGLGPDTFRSVQSSAMGIVTRQVDCLPWDAGRGADGALLRTWRAWKLIESF